MMSRLSGVAGAGLAREVLREPACADHYFALARDPRSVPDATLRADLLVWWMLAAGASPVEVSRIVESGAVWRTKRYVAVMSALRENGGSIVPERHVYERMIAARPPAGRVARKVALQHLLNTDDIGDFSGPGSRVMVAAMPKSASTYLCTLIANVLGRPMVTPHSVNDALGVGFDMLDFVRAYAQGGVMHTHLDASIRTLTVVQLLGLRPIVQTRNIFDALASYLDHIATRRYPGSRFAELSPEQRRRVGIMRIARHYVDMVASWSLVPDAVDVLWIDYEAVRTDPVAVVRDVLGHVGLRVDIARIEAKARAADLSSHPPEKRAALRVNEARPHRGAMFTDQEKSWVRTLYAEYPDVDFSRIDPQIA